MDYRTLRAKVKRPTSRQIQAAKNLSDGTMSIKDAMIGAGYSPVTAHLGMNAVPQTVLALMPKECNLIELGRALKPNDLTHLVTGRLALNTMRGKDAGSLSAKTLGSRADLNMFTPENQVGVIVINSPSAGDSDIIDAIEPVQNSERPPK